MDLYLKEVQMENFKSFGKKITVPFFPGFTAITGPNGSGKSNIADAILFVLGPKSSKVMRAGRLTDLIFNGGKKQKNPAKYCRVSLIFDNSDRKMSINSDEVFLTRMIKRAPLKEDPLNYYTYYYVNDKSSTYTEFMKLLQDARLTGDGYNIVKQGDVTNIIEMGGVDRRRIIDEIAGINHFNKDLNKAETEKNDVDANMDRINIILREIKTQLTQLKNDRDEAIRYNELKQQLYEYKAKIAEKKKQEIQKQISEIQQQIETYTKEQSNFTAQVDTLKKQYKENQEKLQQVEEQIAAVGGDEVSEITKELENLRKEEIIIEERINYSSDETRDLKAEVTQYKQRLEQIQKELQKYNEQQTEKDEYILEQTQLLTEKEQELTQLKETIASSTDKSMDIKQELTKLRQNHDDTQNKLHTHELKLQRINEHIESIDQQLAELQETKETYAFEIKDTEWQIQEEKKHHTEQNKTKKSLEKTLFTNKKQESEYTEQLAELDTIIRKYQQQQIKLQTEYDAIATMHQKYNRAVIEVLKARDAHNLQGIHGTIAELAQVEDTYKTALAIAAGGRMQSIIVDDDTAAAKAIQFLQRKKLGRATFLPLNKMITGKPRGKALMTVKDPNSHGFAIDLVDFKDEYRGAFWYVFGDTVVVNNLDDARRLMGGVRLVDIKGSLIEASGAMIGGVSKRTHLSFTKADRSKLEEVTKELQNAIEAQDNVSNELAELKKDIVEIENSLGEIRTKGDKDVQVKDLDVRRKEFSGKIDVITKDLEERIKEKEDLEEKKKEVISTIQEYKKRIEELDEIKEEKGKLLLKGTKKELAQNARSLEDEVTKLQETVLGLSSKKDAIEKKIEILEERKSELSTNIENKSKDIEKLKKSINELKESRSAHRDELKALMNVEEQMTGKLKDLTTERDSIYKKTVTIENELDKINTRIESYYDLISRAKYRLPTFDDSIKELEQEMKLYNVEITDTNLPNVESLKDSIKVIEESMRELEPVNMRALEEYEHQTERKKKLDEDVKHLKNQKKNLITLVSEITEKKKERFLEVFDSVNKNFKNIYSQLSENGEAELKLEDPESIFESGLTIKARPRGKKVLLLSALSGGEKSIASIAFIFAIQHYDPSPFYVLDEVDMFLDGVNAETVSRMVKRNAEDSQFIMVTLRKIALKEANHVYGVTMRENGVSEMIGNIDPSTVGPTGEINIEGGKMVGTA